MPYHPRISDHTSGSFNPSPYWTQRSPVLEWETQEEEPPAGDSYFGNSYFGNSYFGDSYFA